eukprot:m.251237 g.251237  ORF g.251237 m.251237 type:complete len:63 (-) comp90591_c0_seq1:53-241(-)
MIPLMKRELLFSHKQIKEDEKEKRGGNFHLTNNFPFSSEINPSKTHSLQDKEVEKYEILFKV